MFPQPTYRQIDIDIMTCEDIIGEDSQFLARVDSGRHKLYRRFALEKTMKSARAKITSMTSILTALG